MRVLVANAGSSSLKLSVIAAGDETQLTAQTGPPDDSASLADLRAFVTRAGAVDAVGHRIAHGGPRVREAMVIDDAVRRSLEAGADIAPLHVPPALRIVDELRRTLHVPQVACVDTAFHARMSSAATTYALPARWRGGDGVRRYGFHGLSCAWSLRRAAALLQREPASLQLVVAHLGAGASVTAVRDAHGVDTSMGFTPLDGLVMATRSGSLDPGALLWLQRTRGVTSTELDTALEHDSGLRALGGSADMHDVLAGAAAGDAASVLARDVFVHRACACIGAVAASLERLDAIVFTGGIGEHEHEIRRAICAGLQVLGVPADIADVPGDTDRVLTAPGGACAVLLVHAREDVEIAREVRALLSR